MGLINEWVEVGLNGQTAKHYESLGYNIPKTLNAKGKPYVKAGTKILVRVEHLTVGSGCLVEVECEECSKRYFMPYYSYLKFNHDGKIYCNHCNSKILCSGKNAWNYNPNRDEDERFRGSVEYKEFVKSVLARDDYTCQCCGKKSDSDIEVHHLYGYAGFPKYRIDQTQSLVLCEKCHTAFHNWHGLHYGYNNKGNCTREQFEEWYGKTVKKLDEYNGILIATRKVYCIDNNTVYDSAEIARKELNIYGKTQIYKVCNGKQYVANNLHFLWYDDYINMTKQDIEAYVYKCDNPISYRKVICIETQEVFNKPADASLKYCGDFKKTPKIIRACKEFRTALKDENGKLLHWMYYDEYLSKIENGEEIIFHKNRNKRKVICITTNKIFNTVKDAGLYYKIAPNSISACCRGKLHFTGKSPEGVSLFWMYYDEYLSKINNGEKIELPKREHYRKMVVCITTGKIFDYIKDGANYYDFHPMGITSQLKGKNKTAGKLPDGTPLKWMYYSDFLNLPQEEQEEILNQNKDSSITDGSFII